MVWKGLQGTYLTYFNHVRVSSLHGYLGFSDVLLLVYVEYFTKLNGCHIKKYIKLAWMIFLFS